MQIIIALHMTRNGAGKVGLCCLTIVLDIHQVRLNHRDYFYFLTSYFIWAFPA